MDAPLTLKVANGSQMAGMFQKMLVTMGNITCTVKWVLQIKVMLFLTSHLNF